jgi:hypothetical protein
MIRYCELFGYGGKSALTNVYNDLTHVSVPVEDESQQSATFTHAHKGPALSCPLMSLADQYFRTHFNVLQDKHKQPNFINNKEGIHNSNSSTKATNNQISS